MQIDAEKTKVEISGLYLILNMCIISLNSMKTAKTVPVFLAVKTN